MNISKILTLNIMRSSTAESKKKLTEEQKVAWERTRKRMEKGFNLGGKGAKRDELYTDQENHETHNCFSL